MTDKAALRQQLLQTRGQLRPDQVVEHSESVNQHLHAHPDIQSATVLAAYLPVGNEVDLRPFIRQALSLNRTVGLPRCHSGLEYEFASVSHLDTCVPGEFSIPEPPPNNPTIALSTIDVIFVPLVGVDRNGHRLGMGKGIYDRLLNGFEGLTIGVGYAFQLCDEVPTDPWDIPLSGIVCETGVTIF